eukprot:scaffold7806_cov250-Ochromonas_danica.AAC.17
MSVVPVTNVQRGEVCGGVGMVGVASGIEGGVAVGQGFSADTNEGGGRGRKKEGGGGWKWMFWLISRLSLVQHRLFVRFSAPLVLAGVTLAWSELQQVKEKGGGGSLRGVQLLSVCEAFFVLSIILVALSSVWKSMAAQNGYLSLYWQLSREPLVSLANDEVESESVDRTHVMVPPEDVLRGREEESTGKCDSANGYVEDEKGTEADELHTRFVVGAGNDKEMDVEELDEDSDDNFINVLFQNFSSSSASDSMRSSSMDYEWESETSLDEKISRVSWSDSSGSSSSDDLESSLKE